MARNRIAARIDLSLPTTQQRPVSTTTTLAKPVRITEAQVSDPEVLAKQLNNMNEALAAATQAQRSHPEQAPVTFSNVVCGVGGTKIVLGHNFNANAEYIVVKWKGATTADGHRLVCDEDDVTGSVTDKNTLALRSYVRGTATIRVYPGA